MRSGDQRGEGLFEVLVTVAFVTAIVVWQLHRVGLELEGPSPRLCLAEDPGFALVGSGYDGGLRTQDLDQCKQSCLSDDRCRALSFDSASNQCWLQDAPGSREPKRTFVSAVKVRCP